MNDQAKYTVTLEFETSGADAEARALREIQRGIDDVAHAGIIGERSQNRMSRATEGATKSIRAASASMPTLRYALYDVSSTLMTTGAAMTGLSVAAASAAISMDRQFADVLRTSEAYLDSTGRSASDLRDSFESLFTSMPSSWAELTEIGTLAGQLNIAKDDIAEFTELVAMFAATTDVSVEQSATAFGRLSQLLDVPSTEFQNLGSSILAVGVNSVATESQIIAISSQIASMANSAGFSADEVFGLSSALASLGTQPELSRGVITRLFTNIQAAIAGGGERLEAFGRLSGQTGAEFAQAWGGDAAGAILKMMEGLGQVEQSRAALVLNDLGITASRDVPTILRLAQNSEVLAESLQVAADGYRDGTALQEQYSVISSTVSEKIQILINNLQNFVATLGQAGGAIGGVIDVAIGLVGVFTDLVDNPITATIIGLAGAVTALGGPLLLIAGLGVRGAASLIAFRTAMTEAAIAGGRLTSANVAARLSMTQLTAAALQGSGAMTAFSRASKLALTGTGVGVALLAIGAAWEVVENSINGAARAFEKYFGTAAGLEEAVAADSREYAAAVESGNQAVAESFVIVERASRATSPAFDENRRTADAAAQVLGIYDQSARNASGAADELTTALGANTLEWMKNALAQSEAFRSNAGDANFQEYLNILSNVGFEMEQFLITARDKGAGAAQEYVDSFTSKMDDAQLSEVISLKLDYGVDLAVRDLADAAGGLGEKLAEAEAVNNLLGISAQQTSGDLLDESNSALDLVNSLFEAESALLNTENAMFNLGQSMFENGDAFGYYSESGRENLSSLIAVMKALAEESGGDAQVTASNYQALFEFIQSRAPGAAGALNLLRNGIASLGVQNVKSSGRNFESFFGGWNAGAQRAEKSTRSANNAVRDSGAAAREAQKEVRTVLDYANDLASVWDRAFDIRFSSQSTFDEITTSIRKIWEENQRAAQAIRDLRTEIRSLKADMQGIQSEIGINEYWLGIAREYGDTKRVAAIEATLAKLRADLAKKSDELKDAQKELKKEQDSTNKSLTGHTDAAIANRKTMMDLVKQYQDHIRSLAASGLSQSELAKRTDELKRKFIEQATQLGFSRKEVEKYAKGFDDVSVAIAKVPRKVTVEIAGLGPAQAALKEFESRVKTSMANARKAVGGGVSLPVRTTVDNSAAVEALSRMYDAFDTYARMLPPGPSRTIAQTTGVGLAAILRGIRGWETGGYTGPGARNEPAGIVHRGEYVLPKHMVNQSTGMPYADALGRLMTGIPGYAGGGPVGRSSSPAITQVSLTAGTIQAIARAIDGNVYLNGDQISQAVSDANRNMTAVGAN